MIGQKHITSGDDEAAAAAAFGFNGERMFVQGLTKREWFAGMAIQGMAQMNSQHEEAAKRAVSMADALIKKLNE